MERQAKGNLLSMLCYVFSSSEPVVVSLNLSSFIPSWTVGWIKKSVRERKRFEVWGGYLRVQ